MKAGWQTKTLENMCEIYQPQTITTKEMVEDGAYSVFGANGIIGRYNKFNHEKPQLLITCRGATCGAVNISEPFSWVTGNAMVVRPKNAELDLQLLEYIFRGAIDISKAITGAAQPQITRTNLAPIKISYPISILEQQRIVAILNEAFEGIAIATANAKKNLANARELFESYLYSIFTQTGEGWHTNNLGGVCTFENGDRGVNYPSKSVQTITGVPFVNAGHLTDDGIDMLTMNYIPRVRFDLLGAGKIQAGDILFCLRGSLGKCASVGNMTEGAIASSLVIIRPNDSVLKGFLLAYLRSHLCAEMIEKYRGGAAQPNLSAQSLKQFVIAIPSIETQKTIMTKLDALNLETKKLGAIYQQKITALEELKKSILNQAFSGQLN